MFKSLSFALVIVVVFAGGLLAKTALNRFQARPTFGLYVGDDAIPGVTITPTVDTMGGTCALIYAYNGVPFSAVTANEDSCR